MQGRTHRYRFADLLFFFGGGKSDLNGSQRGRFNAEPTRLLAELVEEGLPGVRVVPAGQLQEGARLFPLLHEPQA